MGYQFQPKNERTMAQSLKVQDLKVSGLDLDMYAITAASSPGPSLGEAEQYAVLAGSGITNTGSSIITGDIGSDPTGTITGFPPGVVVGTQHSADASSTQAKIDRATAYAALIAMTPDQDLSGQDLGTIGTLTAGVYEFSSSAGLTGTLTLDAQGDPNALFVFQIGTTLTTAASSSIVLANGALPGNVYWAVGSSATLGTSSTFKGDILAEVSITVTTSANVVGRLLADSGAVTLDTNIVTLANSGSAGSCVIKIREIVDRVYLVRVKNDLLNTWTEFNQANITIVDSESFLAAAPGVSSDRGAILIAGLDELADDDIVEVNYVVRGRL